MLGGCLTRSCAISPSVFLMQALWRQRPLWRPSQCRLANHCCATLAPLLPCRRLAACLGVCLTRTRRSTRRRLMTLGRWLPTPLGRRAW